LLWQVNLQAQTAAVEHRKQMVANAETSGALPYSARFPVIHRADIRQEVINQTGCITQVTRNRDNAVRLENYRRIACVFDHLFNRVRESPFDSADRVYCLWKTHSPSLIHLNTTGYSF